LEKNESAAAQRGKLDGGRQGKESQGSPTNFYSKTSKWQGEERGVGGGVSQGH